MRQRWFVFGLMILACGRVLAQGRGGAATANRPPIASIRLGAADSSTSEAQVRTLVGAVKDADEKPVKGATVYLKNVKTAGLLSVTTDEKGTFRFVALQQQVDYEFWAQEEKKRSETKTISQFDDTMHFTRNLILTAKALEK